MNTTPSTADADIPSRRIAAKDHLKRAAAAPVASDAEHYHLRAAIAETLVHIDDRLALIARLLAEHATHDGDQ